MNFFLPKLIGHRGVKDLAPENTLFSIKKAKQFNLQWIEIDVKISKDKIPFLLHDDNLDRTTSGKGMPIQYLYKQILNLDAGSWFNIKFKNLYAPTLKEVLQYCSQNSIGVNIEIKPNIGFKKATVLAVVKLIKKLKFSCPYYISSFDWYSINLTRKLLPESYLGILLDKNNIYNNYQYFFNKCKKNNINICGFNKKIISKKLVKASKKYGMLVTVYSSKNIKKTEANHLWNLGIDSIFIDNPTSYKKILNSN